MTGTENRAWSHHGGTDARRGAALLIAIIVLTALFLLAVPFAVFMRLQHSAGTQALQSARAHFGETGALNHARTVLYSGLDNTEQLNLADPSRFPFNDPLVDTLWEFHVTLRTRVSLPDPLKGVAPPNIIPRPDAADLPEQEYTFIVDDALGFPSDGKPQTVDGYIRVDEEWMAYSHVADLDPTVPPAFPCGRVTVRKMHRGLLGTAGPDPARPGYEHPAGAVVSFFPHSELWRLDVKDQQSRININTAPARVMMNLLGYLRIDDESPEDTPSNFPTWRQQYIAAAIASYGASYSYWENADGSNDVPDGTYTPFQNIDMVKNISVAPEFVAGTYAPLSAEELDLIRPYITVHSTYRAGESAWRTLFSGSPETDAILDSANPDFGQDITVVNLPDGGADNIPIGAHLRLTLPSGAQEFATVLSKNGTDPGRRLAQAFPPAPVPGTMHVADTSGLFGRYQGVPCYVLLRNPLDPLPSWSWVLYSGVGQAPGEVTLTGCFRNQFGTNYGPAYPAGMVGVVDGDVVVLDREVSENITTADTFVIEMRNRHAININTVRDPIILQSILTGVSDGTDVIDATEAADIAEYILWYTSGGQNSVVSAPPTPGPPHEFFDGNEDWIDGNDADFSAQGNDPSGEVVEPGPPPGPPPWANAYDELNAIFDQLEVNGDINAVERDFLKANFNALAPGNWPVVSSLPLCVNSGTLIGIDSMGMVDDRAGTPVARSPRSVGVKLARVYDVVPPLEPVWWMLRSQKEFSDNTTGPVFPVFLTNPLHALLPPPSDDPVYTDPSDGIGTAGPGLDTLNWTNYTTLLEGLHGAGAPDFDLDAARGTVLEQSGATEGVGTTTSQGITNVQLEYETDYAQAAGARNIEADGVHATIQPFAVEFWMRPRQVAPRQLLVDLGDGSDAIGARNQVRIYLENGNVVLRMDDQIAGATATGTPFGGGVICTSSVAFAADQWHHVAIATAGTFRDEIAMFIDGVYDRAMTWQYEFGDPAAPTPVDEATVREGYFWPVAMTVPLARHATTVGPSFWGGQWIWLSGSNEIGLTDITDLPEQGWVAIDSTAHRYEYNGFGSRVVPSSPPVTVSTIQLVTPLQESHSAGEPVTVMIPVVQPAAHKPEPLAPNRTDIPEDGDLVAFWGHADPAGVVDDAFQADDVESDTVTVATIVPQPLPIPPDVGRFPLYYRWLVIDPQTAADPVVSGFPGSEMNVDKRWKVFNYSDFTSSTAGVLAGVLPTGRMPINPGDPADTFLVCGPKAADGITFTGDLDELRITALADALVSPASLDWLAGQTTVNALEWAHVDPPGPVDERLVRVWGARNPLTESMVPPPEPLHAEGGYFMVEGQVYSYESYGAGQIQGVLQVNDDLTPTLNAGLTVAHTDLHRIIPLSFITTTRLPGAWAGGPGSEDIPVVDASQFPDEGYVKIDGEIIAYSGRSFVGIHQLLRPTNVAGVSAYPRGAYDTLPAVHNIDAIVRHLPVRHPDRYRAGANWADHEDYSLAQLEGPMCRFSYTVNHAGRLSKVEWDFKEKQLEDDQKVAVLIMIDGAAAWNTNPSDTADERFSDDMLWGTVSRGNNTKGGALSLFTLAGEHPTVTTGVEVRFYFDLGDTQVYNWSNMVEIDLVGVEMVPEATTF